MERYYEGMTCGKNEAFIVTEDNGDQFICCKKKGWLNK
jgi:hypothetical protein